MIDVMSDDTVEPDGPKLTDDRHFFARDISKDSFGDTLAIYLPLFEEEGFTQFFSRVLHRGGSTFTYINLSFEETKRLHKWLGKRIQEKNSGKE